MASQTRNKIPRPAVYRKRHKALQHLTDANTNHGFGQRIVIHDVGHNSTGESCFGISGPSGVQMFQSVNPGNYREAATKKEPKYRQMPVRQTSNQIESRSRRYRQRRASSTSPPVLVQNQRVKESQALGYQDPCQEPRRMRDGVTATIQMPADNTEHASRQYADTPRYPIQTPFDKWTFTSGPARMAPTTWSQSQTQSPVSSDYSDLSDTPDASWQDLDPQRFGRVSMNTPNSVVGPTLIDIGGHANDLTANNNFDYGDFRFLTDGLGFPAYSQGDVTGDPNLLWDGSGAPGSVPNNGDRQYELPWVAGNDYDLHASSLRYSRDPQIENQNFLTYQYPVTDYN